MKRRKFLSALGTSVASMSILKYSTSISESIIKKSETRIIGHRGCSKTKKDNSLEGIKCAMDSGANGVEIDIHETSDGKFVLNHDPHIINGADIMLIRNNTLKEIQAKTDRLSLREALDILSEKNKFTVYLDLKSMNIASKVVKIVKEYNMLDSVVVIAWLVSEFNSINDLNVKTGLISYYPSMNLVERAKENNINAIIPHYTSQKLNHIMKFAHQNNIECGYWTISDSKEDIIKGLSINPDFMITNQPNYAHEYLNKNCCN